MSSEPRGWRLAAADEPIGPAGAVTSTQQTPTDALPAEADQTEAHQTQAHQTGAGQLGALRQPEPAKPLDATRAELAKLPRNSWHVFEDVRGVGDGAGPHHLAIGPGGLFWVTTLRAEQGVAVDGNGWFHEAHAHGSQAHDSHTHHSHGHHSHASSLRAELGRVRKAVEGASGIALPMLAVAALTGGEAESLGQPIGTGVRFVSCQRLATWLEAEPKLLAADTALRVAAAVQRLFGERPVPRRLSRRPS